MTELSDVEELALLNDKYQDVCMEKAWEILKKEKTGTILYDTALGLYYVILPDDFSFLVENNAYTQNNTEIYNNAAPKVIFVGAARAIVQVINFSDRRQYRNNNRVAYVDLAANRIYFCGVISDTSYYSYDYIYVPEDLEANDSPIFPDRFHKMLAFAMAVDDDILQKSPKARSYAPENNAKYNKTLDLMGSWNANLQLF